MITDNDEKALVALLATRLHPDVQQYLTRPEIEALLATSEAITNEERAIFESIDPLELIRKPNSNHTIIQFPVVQPEADLPLAAGFYRGGSAKEANDNARESVKTKRTAIREELRKKSEDAGGSEQDD